MSMREGLAQHERLPAALEPHYIDVDELTQAQLMAMALQYAGLVRFAEPGDPGTWSRTWRQYLAGDETLVMAEILALRVHHKRAQFDRMLDLALASIAPGGAPVPRHDLPTVLIGGMVQRLRGWADVLGRGSPAAIDLGNFITGMLGKLPSGLQDALQIRAAHPAAPSDGSHALVHELAAALGLAPDAALRDHELRAHFRMWFNQLAKGIEMIQRSAARQLENSLASGTHDPGAGLLLAFVQLYAHVQRQANTLTGRHQDFYYDRVLRMRQRGAERDTTFLVLEPAAPGTPVVIPPDTPFLAPVGPQQPDLVYASPDGLAVGGARLRALHTLFCERNPLTAPENQMSELRNGTHKPYPTACRVAALPVLQPERALDKANLVPNPLFGAPRTATSAGAGVAARLGFALASNVLLMAEGERTVSVTLFLDAAREAARDIPATLGARLHRLAERMDESAAEVQYKVLRRMFTLAVTGADGWIAIPAYGAAFVPGGAASPHDALHLHFTLAHGAGAVTGYAPAVHGPDGVGTCPMLRVELNSEGYLYPYGLLRGLPLARATIDVNVRGHRSLILHNQMGALSTAAPFQPFGPLPARGSYLVVGSEETACKRLTAAELVFEWGGLPQVPGGLRAWYGGYEGVAYEGVRCAVGVLADGRWVPGAAQAPVPQIVFADDLVGRRAQFGPTEAVQLNPVLHLARPRPPGRPLVYGPGASDGFFRLTLVTSDFAFGHRDYPYQLARTLTHNSQARFRREPLPLPNPPYTPTVEALAMNYRATASVEPTPAVSGEALLRLHPFGWELARGGSEGGDLLVPQIEYSGNLFLGLAGAQPGTSLTLFFHLVEDALPMARRHARNISWAYLADNQWKPLAPHALLSDSTQGFLRPGIVTLVLPSDLGRASTVMPDDLAWLRVSCEDELNKFCQLYSVHPHALQVWRTRDAAAAGAQPPARIEAGTIRRPRQTIPGLARVTQMTASAGGRLPEDARQLRRRSAERLRHKGRAVAPEDYERLVLERFPEIDRVKCFPNLSIARRPDGGACPGHVLVVALPPFASNGHMQVLPRLNGDVIARVHAYLAERIGAGVKLEVANPFYQRIQVRCKVRLTPGVDQGRQVNLLDRLVSDFISPWNTAGNTSPFGWNIRQHDIESFILAQAGVLGVTEFSMLSVSDAVSHRVPGSDHDTGGDRYLLTDTAAPTRDGIPVPDVSPLYPWSVAVPIRRHAILVEESEQSRIARRTGIGKLEIGSTFIISNENDGTNHDQT